LDERKPLSSLENKHSPCKISKNYPSYVDLFDYGKWEELDAFLRTPVNISDKTNQQSCTSSDPELAQLKENQGTYPETSNEISNSQAILATTPTTPPGTPIVYSVSPEGILEPELAQLKENQSTSPETSNETRNPPAVLATTPTSPPVTPIVYSVRPERLLEPELAQLKENQSTSPETSNKTRNPPAILATTPTSPSVMPIIYSVSPEGLLEPVNLLDIGWTPDQKVVEKSSNENNKVGRSDVKHLLLFVVYSKRG
jgi:hypothetical protein